MFTINIILKSYPHLKKYLFFNNRLTQNSKILISESSHMSSGEQILIKVALDLWDSSGNSLLKDIYQSLDSENYHNVIKSINLKRDGY